MKHSSFLCVVICGAFLCAVFTAGPGFAQQIQFNRDVRPILSKHCFQCHGFDKHTREAGVRLDEREPATAKLDNGKTPIVPGDPAASEMIRRIFHEDPDERMPPAKTGKPLDDQQKNILRRWIKQGAEYQAHWAFIPPTRPTPPKASKPAWINNPIDAFVLARLDAENLSPAPRADKRTLIRRLSLDLTGLPPTLDEVQRFLADDSPDAYEQLVDRLLASPHYGEKMARQWLDLARYADTHGYQYDQKRTQWPWRDWVIKAFNNNMPYDQFTIEQLAGDLLESPTASQRLATGFNRNHPITIEGGVIDEEYRVEYVVDRVSTTSTVWMGLTMGCARCHDHKFDPLSQQDFYSFFAYFNSVPEIGNGNKNKFAPVMNVVSPLQREQVDTLDDRIAKLEKQVGDTESTMTLQTPTSLHSRGGATLTLLDDQSVLASGKNPDTDVYTVKLATQQKNVGRVQLEALTHPSLTQQSLSRGSNGNFVLNEITVEVAPANEPDHFKPVQIAHATADYEQRGWPVANAHDGNAKTGWAVDGNSKPVDRQATFHFKEPVTFDAGVALRITMHFNYGMSHAIGRFRVGVDAVVPAEAELAKLKQQRRRVQAHGRRVMVMADTPKPRQAYVLTRGEYDKRDKDQPVSPRPPEALGAALEGAPQNRLGLAQWLTQPDHPLTARVQVNRLWMQLFGTGIVKTAEDFGTQGEWPSHPKLLDWLAVEFVESGWDIKHMLKRMVMSATYQQASDLTPKSHERDPQNRLLARGPRFRLSAEQVRDYALTVSGLLNDTIGGPSVYPYHPKGLWLELNNRPGVSKAYEQDEGDKLYRRSLYTFWKRTVPPPSLNVFDAPGREFCMVRRSSTNTPLQALVLLHDPQYVEAGRLLAERVMHGADDVEARIDRAFRLVTMRPPQPDERATLHRIYTEQKRKFTEDLSAAHRLLEVGEHPRDQSLDPIEHAAWTNVARTLLNLHETITRG